MLALIISYYLVCPLFTLKIECVGSRGYKWVFIITICILMGGERNSDFLNTGLRALLI